jgi:4'-phosphopantetheinyl transferase EntD
MQADAIIKKIKSMADPDAIAGMARFGINPKNNYGVGIGKRNMKLNRKAVAAAKTIRKIDSKTARWVASDALRELTSEKVLERLKAP